MMIAAIALGSAPAQASTGKFWQCATFARMFSGVQLFGRAANWWEQAIGKYAQGATPVVGSVMVFKAISSMRAGHVATVSQIISDRVVKVTHANWSHPGKVENDVTVMDTSEKGDWSRVRVWYASLRDLGRTNYPLYGFIYGGKASATAKSIAASAAPSAVPAITLASIAGPADAAH
jgi:surface antigen